jgi:hypothetical protein
MGQAADPDGPTWLFSELASSGTTGGPGAADGASFDAAAAMKSVTVTGCRGLTSLLGAPTDFTMAASLGK